MRLIENLLQDFTYAIRQLRRSPIFAGTAVFVPVLGISASIAIFTLVDAALIKPLPYRDPSRLVAVFGATSVNSRASISYLDYRDWSRSNTVFSSIAGYGGSGGWGFTLETPEGPQHVPGMHVSGNFFNTLGVTPVIGRGFYAGEDSLGAPAAALLSYSAWQKRFAARDDVLGQAVTLDGVPTIIIGVLPAGFSFPPAGAAEFWSALRPSPSHTCENQRSCSSVYTVARLKSGVSIQVALAQTKAIAGRLQQLYPESHRGLSAGVVPLRDVIAGDIRPILLMLLAGSALFLVMSFTNVSGLLLSRSDSRRREIAVRSAIGASYARLFGQFAAEALTLALAGTLAGLFVSTTALHLLTTLLPPDTMAGMPYLQDLGIDSHVMLFAAAIFVVAILIFAGTPLLRLSGSDRNVGLRDGDRGSAGTTWKRFGRALVVIELCFAVILLVGAGLLGKSIYRLLQVDIGFNPNHVVTLNVFQPTGFSDPNQVIALSRQIVDRVAILPGVQSVGISDQMPLGYGWNGVSFDFIGQPNDQSDRAVSQLRVGPGYFSTLQARLLRGRNFTRADGTSSQPVAIINDTFANRYFRGKNPVGSQISYHQAPDSAMQIVGVIADVKEAALDAPAQPALYVPFDQKPNDSFFVVVRTRQAAQSSLPSLKAAIHAIQPEASTEDGGTMQELLERSPSTYLRRSSTSLVGSFAAISFVLSMVGLYGVIAYSVSQRTREMGVRMALGAESGSVIRLILGEAGRLTVLGLILGLACSLETARLLRSLLFNVTAWDVSTLAGVSILLVASALLASYIPARRAASVNPLEALRAE